MNEIREPGETTITINIYRSRAPRRPASRSGVICSGPMGGSIVTAEIYRVARIARVRVRIITLRYNIIIDDGNSNNNNNRSNCAKRTRRCQTEKRGKEKKQKTRLRIIVIQ